MTYESFNHDPISGLSVGDHVYKAKGATKFIGRLLTIYRVPHEERLWGVILLDKNEASDHLQHLYPLELFEKIPSGAFIACVRCSQDYDDEETGERRKGGNVPISCMECFVCKDCEHFSECIQSK